MKKVKEVLNVLGDDIKNELEKLDNDILKTIVEIRIRCNREIEIITIHSNFFIKNFCTNQRQISSIVEKCCKYSIYSFQKDIDKGFVTLKGGHRVGVVGRFIEKEKGDYTISEISSINIRISRQVFNCANKLYELILKQKDANILLCGAPLTGKTTFLRDICRILSDIKNKKVSIIDERNEIANTFLGESQHYVGKKSDVLSYYPKKTGIITAIRTMSPQYIVCDEIGSTKEISVLSESVNTGCYIVASIHSDYCYNRKMLEYIVRENIFDYLVFLHNKPIICHIEKIVKIR